MLIIAGKLYVAPERRDEYVESFVDFVRRARMSPGCLDISIAADPVEAGRVNNFERWESNEQLREFQAVANPPDSLPEVLSDDVALYEISSSGPVFPERPSRVTEGESAMLSNALIAATVATMLQDQVGISGRVRPRVEPIRRMPDPQQRRDHPGPKSMDLPRCMYGCVRGPHHCG